MSRVEKKASNDSKHSRPFKRFFFIGGHPKNLSSAKGLSDIVKEKPIRESFKELLNSFQAVLSFRSKTLNELSRDQSPKISLLS